MDTLREYLVDIWQIFLDMSPYLLFGFLIAGLLHVFIPKHLFNKHLGKPGIISTIKAALLGIPLPLCSCGVIPTGVSLYQNGASKGATNSFLISTPQTGADSILVTYSLMNVYWAIARPIIAFSTAIFGGWLAERKNDITESQISKPQEPIKNETDDMSFSDKLKRVFSYAFIDFLSDISRPLIIGVLLAAIITNVIPPSLFENYLTMPLLNMFIILIASIPLYICATASVPVATALLMVGVSPGAVLVFLMAGPATNIATITVLWKTLGKRTTIAYLTAIIIGAFIFGFLIDYILPSHFFTLPASKIEPHIHQGEKWLSITAAIILILLILWLEYKKLFPTKMNINEGQKQYEIEGMTCNHCKASVENNMIKIDGITSAKVDLPTKTLVVEGKISDVEIACKINDLGFEFKGPKG